MQPGLRCRPLRDRGLRSTLERRDALTDCIQVVVEDVDPNGKISLKPIGDGPEVTGGDAEGSAAGDDGGGSSGSPEQGDRIEVSFEETFDAGLAEEFGDLGPEAPRRSGGGGGRGRGRGGRGRR